MGSSNWMFAMLLLLVLWLPSLGASIYAMAALLFHIDRLAVHAGIVAMVLVTLWLLSTMAMSTVGLGEGLTTAFLPFGIGLMGAILGSLKIRSLDDSKPCKDLQNSPPGRE